MGFPDASKEYQSGNLYGMQLGGPVKNYDRLIVVYENGAIDDREAVRSALMTNAPLIEVNPGMRFDIYRNPKSCRFVAERGAVNDAADVERELARTVSMICVNPGMRFDILEG